MKRRIVRMAWGLLALSLVAGNIYKARSAEQAPIKEANMQTTGSAVSEVNFDAEFYSPAGSPKKLAVLVLGGSDGGIPSRRAKLIAANGFPALALAYFKTKRSSTRTNTYHTTLQGTR
jgi:hypothetical protein